MIDFTSDLFFTPLGISVTHSWQEMQNPVLNSKEWQDLQFQLMWRILCLKCKICLKLLKSYRVDQNQNEKEDYTLNLSEKEALDALSWDESDKFITITEEDAEEDKMIDLACEFEIQAIQNEINQNNKKKQPVSEASSEYSVIDTTNYNRKRKQEEISSISNDDDEPYFSKRRPNHSLPDDVVVVSKPFTLSLIEFLHAFL